MEPQQGDILCLISSSTHNLNDVDVIQYQFVSCQRRSNGLFEIMAISNRCDNNIARSFLTSGFDDDGVEKGRSNNLFVINPTSELVKKLSTKIFAKHIMYNNSHKRLMFN